MTPLRRWTYRVPVLLYSGAIIWMSSQSITVPEPFSLADKVYHLLAYLVYGGMLMLAMQTFQISPRARMICALIVGLVFAASDEVHQAFVPGRTADIVDWCADALGIIIAVVITSIWQRYAHA